MLTLQAKKRTDVHDKNVLVYANVCMRFKQDGQINVRDKTHFIILQQMLK